MPIGVPSLSVLRHVTDVHCHPTDSHISPMHMGELPITICAMATCQSDQRPVHDLAETYPTKVIPCFGHHPWFVHRIALRPISKEDHYRNLFLSSSNPSKSHEEAFNELLPRLPDPTPINEVIAELRNNLTSFPNAMVGEVGLDRVSRVPLDYTAFPRHLTPFNIPLNHQLAVLRAQLDVAVELGRNISMHSVKSQKATFDLLIEMAQRHGEKWFNLSLDLHSCGFSPEMWKDIERKFSNVFLSLSTAINGRSPNRESLIAICSPKRILVESDFHDIQKTTERTWDMILVVAAVKHWDVEETWDDEVPAEQDEWGVVRRLEANWKAFQQGGHHVSNNDESHRNK